jgi:hypothetical protein
LQGYRASSPHRRYSGSKAAKMLMLLNNALLEKPLQLSKIAVMKSVSYRLLHSILYTHITNQKAHLGSSASSPCVTLCYYFIKESFWCLESATGLTLVRHADVNHHERPQKDAKHVSTELEACWRLRAGSLMTKIVQLAPP